MKSTEFKINNIYRATEGEGIFVGIPQIFVRFQGCATGCLNCDSKETWDFQGGSNYSITSLFKEIESFHIKRVSITGGDPLHPMHEASVLELVRFLKKRDYFVNIEASGVRINREIFDAVDFISADYKTPSTGVVVPLTPFTQMLKNWGHKMQIKSVVASRIDFEMIVKIREKIGNPMIPWVITPAYTPGESFTLSKVHELLHWNESLEKPFRLIVQQHKLLYGVDRKDV